MCIKLFFVIGLLLSVSCIRPLPDDPFKYTPVPLKELALDQAVSDEHHGIYSCVLFVYVADTNLVLDVSRKIIESLNFTTTSSLTLKIEPKVTNSSQSAIYRYMKENKEEWKNFYDLEYECYRVAFSPPPVPKQRISDGGNWVPREFFIQFEIGHSKRNPRKTFILMERHWLYRTTAHIPGTEIPFLWLPTDERFVLESDVKWLNYLGKKLKVNYVDFGDKMPFHEEVYKNIVE